MKNKRMLLTALFMLGYLFWLYAGNSILGKMIGDRGAVGERSGSIDQPVERYSNVHFSLFLVE